MSDESTLASELRGWALNLSERCERPDLVMEAADHIAELETENNELRERVELAKKYAKVHDYRGNRPRWMTDIPMILGGTDE